MSGYTPYTVCYAADLGVAGDVDLEFDADISNAWMVEEVLEQGLLDMPALVEKYLEERSVEDLYNLVTPLLKSE